MYYSLILHPTGFAARNVYNGRLDFLEVFSSFSVAAHRNHWEQSPEMPWFDPKHSVNSWLAFLKAILICYAKPPQCFSIDAKTFFNVRLACRRMFL